MQKKYKKAFSLVELSIVILITSILITGALGVSRTSKNNEKVKITKERMDIVYKAIGNFVAQNKRLPCPAMLTVAKGGNSATTTTPNNIRYGEESGTSASTKVVGTGVCAQVFNSANRANLAYGAVPTLALGLGPDMAEDGFGTKFSYVVDKRFTKASSGTVATDGFEITQSLPSANNTGADLFGFSVYDEGNPIQILPNLNGVLLLISHGANKLGGFNASGTAQNPVSTIVAEQDNSCSGSQGASCTIAPYAGYDQWFGKTSLSQNFDDIILFKTKAQLVRDAGLEFIMCNAAEAATASITSTTYSWGSNATYGCTLSSNVGVGTNTTFCARRTCGKYGIWGATLATPASAQCGATCTFTNTHYGYITGNGGQSINHASHVELNSEYWNGTATTSGGVSYSAGRFTVSAAGLYIVTAGVSYSGARITGIRSLNIKLNNAGNAWSYINAQAATTDRTGSSGSAIIPMNAGDFVSVVVYQSSDGALNMDSAVVGNFQIAKIQ